MLEIGGGSRETGAVPLTDHTGASAAADRAPFLATRCLCALLCLGLGGCRSLECDDSIAYGVELVIDEPGGPYTEPISVRYRVDGGTWREITDIEMDGIPDYIAVCSSRSRCSLGAELEGLYEVEVRRGRASASFEIAVPSDLCHVVTRVVPLSLPAS